nr:hypothetical protein [uncultured Brevundimonas sp.]
MTRITTSEVCVLGRFSRATLWRRVASGALPAPIDQGREAIFDRDRVVAALAIPRARWRKPKAGTQTSAPSLASGPVTDQKPHRRWSAKRWEFA